MGDTYMLGEACMVKEQTLMKCLGQCWVSAYAVHRALLKLRVQE